MVRWMVSIHGLGEKVEKINFRDMIIFLNEIRIIKLVFIYKLFSDVIKYSFFILLKPFILLNIF